MVPPQSSDGKLPVLRCLHDIAFVSWAEIILIMHAAVNQFKEAHDRYLELDRHRTECLTPVQREWMHIAILKAYLEVQYRAKQIAGLQYADGMDFSEMN